MTEIEKRQADFAKGFDLTFDQYRKLATSLSYIELITCLELLKAKRHKSKSRQRWATTIRAWLDYSDTLKPLSIVEFRMAEPKWPIRYSLPH